MHTTRAAPTRRRRRRAGVKVDRPVGLRGLPGGEGRQVGDCGARGRAEAFGGVVAARCHGRGWVELWEAGISCWSAWAVAVDGGDEAALAGPGVNCALRLAAEGTSLHSGRPVVRMRTVSACHQSARARWKLRPAGARAVHSGLPKWKMRYESEMESLVDRARSPVSWGRGVCRDEPCFPNHVCPDNTSRPRKLRT